MASFILREVPKEQIHCRRKMSEVRGGWGMCEDRIHGAQSMSGDSRGQPQHFCHWQGGEGAQAPSAHLWMERFKEPHTEVRCSESMYLPPPATHTGPEGEGRWAACTVRCPRSTVTQATAWTRDRRPISTPPSLLPVPNPQQRKWTLTLES